MAASIKIGNNRAFGFTLIELLIVLVLVALLARMVTPVVSKSIEKAKEATLKETLFITRSAIDNYYADNDNYPRELSELVELRYLRRVPTDPITESKDSWLFERDAKTQGIMEIKSGSDRHSHSGTPYGEW